MLQGLGLRVERLGNYGLVSRGINPLVHKGGTHGACVVMSATRKVKPRIVRLRKEEVAEVLPWTGSGEQRLHKLGPPSTWLARLAISLAGSVLFYNYNTLAAAMASLYWAWDPVLSTAFANTSLRFQFPYAGLWRAKVLYAKVMRPVLKSRSIDVFQEIFEAKPAVRPFLKLVIGDGSSATLEMQVGIPGKRYQVQAGEPVEVLVLSDIRSLSRFLAVRDVYLPNMGLWLSEDPCIERPVFEDLCESLRERSSSLPITWPSKGQDIQSAKVSSPESIERVNRFDPRDFRKDGGSPETLNPRTLGPTELYDEEFEIILDEDPKLQALRIEDKYKSKELQRRDVQAEPYRPLKQYMKLQEYGSEFRGRWEQAEGRDPNISGLLKQGEVPAVNEGDDYERSDKANSRQATQMTTVDKNRGSKLRRVQDSLSDDRLMQDEESSSPRRIWTYNGNMRNGRMEERPSREPWLMNDCDRVFESEPVRTAKSRVTHQYKEGTLASNQPWEMQRPRTREASWKADKNPRSIRQSGREEHDEDEDEDSSVSQAEIKNKWII